MCVYTCAYTYDYICLHVFYHMYTLVFDGIPTYDVYVILCVTRTCQDIRKYTCVKLNMFPYSK